MHSKARYGYIIFSSYRLSVGAYAGSSKRKFRWRQVTICDSQTNEQSMDSFVNRFDHFNMCSIRILNFNVSLEKPLLFWHNALQTLTLHCVAPITFIHNLCENSIQVTYKMLCFSMFWTWNLTSSFRIPRQKKFFFFFYKHQRWISIVVKQKKLSIGNLNSP